MHATPDRAVTASHSDHPTDWPGEQTVLNHRPQALAQLFESDWIGEQPDYTLLLKPTQIPWLLAVPKQPLTPQRMGLIVSDLYLLAQTLKQEQWGTHENIAKIANQLPWSHLHLVMRSPQDACWPDPIWGQTLNPVSADVHQARIETLTRKVLPSWVGV